MSRRPIALLGATLLGDTPVWTQSFTNPVAVSGLARWYVANYTYGSLFKVQRGVVTISPIRGKNFNLKAGKQFFIFYKRNP